jgi:outer membrane protein TolC
MLIGIGAVEIMMQTVRWAFRAVGVLGIVGLGLSGVAQNAGAPDAAAPSSEQTNAGQTNSGQANAGPVNSGPMMITLADALQRAQHTNPEYRLAVTDYGLAHEDKVQSRAAILPNVNYNNAFIYTEPNGTRMNLPKYIANNFVHEYISQGNAHQVVSLSSIADYKRTAAAEAVAKAKSEIAARGLVVTVVRTYYGMVVAQRKYATEQRAAEEAERFLNISQKLEQGGEVAHSDVIKAQIQFQSTQRDFQESRLGMEQTRLDLAVLIFPDFNENFSVVDDLQQPVVLPEYSEVQTLAAQKNPQLRAAVEALRAAKYEVTSAWGDFLPAGSIDYFYGIDATRFATYGIDPTTGARVNNLGYSVVASLQIPIWNWGASRSRVKQADLRRDQAKVELNFAQRQMVANLRGFYDEAETSKSELESLNHSAELADEGLRLTNLRYQAGEATVLEVVDAQNTLTMARNAYADGQARYRLAIATLQTLTGSF